MKFLIDAQLPKALARFLVEKGYDTIHTLDLPARNRTTDSELRLLSIQQQRIVISKDEDFYQRYRAVQEPYKLIYLTVGNLSNSALLNLFDKNIDHLVAILNHCSVVEMNQHFVISIF